MQWSHPLSSPSSPALNLSQHQGVHWTDWCWSWNSNTLATWCKELTHLKKPWCWERLRAGGEGDNRGWDHCMASPTQWTWVWVDPGNGDGQGGVACYSSWGHKESDTTERLNWTESYLFDVIVCSFYSVYLLTNSCKYSNFCTLVL